MSPFVTNNLAFSDCFSWCAIISSVPGNFLVLHNPSEKTWDDFVYTNDGHLLQTWAWGELKARFGWSMHRLAIEKHGTLVAAAQILFRRLTPGLTLAYIPRGPITTSMDPDALPALFDAASAVARSHRAFALKIESNTRDDAAPGFTVPRPLSPPHWHLQPGACIQPHTTIHLDLTRDHETILAEMKPKWRYNIRVAERKGVTVREGQADDLPRFYELLQLTSVRDAFPIHTSSYYNAAFDLLSSRDCARLFVAQFAGEMIAAIFVTAVGREAIYLYGASGNNHRERMPNHALHWHAIQWAKARGCTRYDLWGVGATAEANADAKSTHGLYQFKQGFGGTIVKYAGARDLVFSRWKFFFYQRALTLRRSAMG